MLTETVRRLAPGRRAVIALRFWQDLIVHETAAILGGSSGTVASQAHRALRTLRAGLSGGYESRLTSRSAGDTTAEPVRRRPSNSSTGTSSPRSTSSSDMYISNDTSAVAPLVAANVAMR